MTIPRTKSAATNQRRSWESRILFTQWRKSKPNSILISNSTLRRTRWLKRKNLSSFGIVSNSTLSRLESKSMFRTPKITWSLSIGALTPEGLLDYYNASTKTVVKYSENGTTSSTIWGSTQTRSRTSAGSKDATLASPRKPTWISIWRSTKERRDSNAITAVAAFLPNSI